MAHTTDSIPPAAAISKKKLPLPRSILTAAWKAFSAVSRAVLALAILLLVYVVYTNWRGERRMRAVFERLEDYGITAAMQVAWFQTPPDEEGDGGAGFSIPWQKQWHSYIRRLAHRVPCLRAPRLRRDTHSVRRETPGIHGPQGAWRVLSD